MRTNNTTIRSGAQVEIRPIYATERKTVQQCRFDGSMVYVPVCFFGLDGKERFVMNACYWINGVQKNKQEIEYAFEQLNDNGGRYFAFYSKEKDVFKFLDWVKAGAFAYERHSAIVMCGDYCDFSGNLEEYSAAFMYRIYDKRTAEAVMRRLPHDFRVVNLLED